MGSVTSCFFSAGHNVCNLEMRLFGPACDAAEHRNERKPQWGLPSASLGTCFGGNVPPAVPAGVATPERFNRGPQPERSEASEPAPAFKPETPFGVTDLSLLLVTLRGTLWPR